MTDHGAEAPRHEKEQEDVSRMDGLKQSARSQHAQTNERSRSSNGTDMGESMGIDSSFGG